MGLALEHLEPDVEARVRPFLEDVLSRYEGIIHSIHMTGSALTGDFDPGASDINSVFVLERMDLGFLEVLAPMGKTHGKRRVASPLVMTPEYIRDSADVFPVEFLNIKLIHETVYGEDIFEGLDIERGHLKHQCEREIKVKLIGLRQGYLAAAGDARAVMERLAASIGGYIPLFRAILVLKGRTPPQLNADVVRTLGQATGSDCAAFEKLLEEKRKREKLKMEELNVLFEAYYRATEDLRRVVDEISL